MQKVQLNWGSMVSEVCIQAYHTQHTENILNEWQVWAHQMQLIIYYSAKP